MKRPKSEIILKDAWRNSVLVIVCLRLGMKKVQPEFLNIIRQFFMQNLNVGILGGRPNEAYYLVGIQDDYLIFLDPHNTQESIPADINQIKQKHMTYHESTAKKIHYSKLDPSLGFACLLRSTRDFQKFKVFLETGK